MEVIILAGGMGTRLRDVLPNVPKPMAPINGKPFLYYLLKWIIQNPIDNIILSVGFKAESIINYFGESFCDIPIEYSVEQKPLGTGGAILYALQKTDNNNILIVNGDTYFPIDLKKFYDAHINSKSQLSIALKPMRNFNRYGSVECDGDTIIRFNEKRMQNSGLINGGTYLINRQIFDKLKFPEVFSFETEILEKEVETLKITGSIFDTIFIDIGIPEDYYRAASILQDNSFDNHN